MLLYNYRTDEIILSYLRTYEYVYSMCLLKAEVNLTTYEFVSSKHLPYQ